MTLAERRQKLTDAAIEKLIEHPPASLSKDDLRKFAQTAFAEGWNALVGDIQRELERPGRK